MAGLRMRDFDWC